MKAVNVKPIIDTAYRVGNKKAGINRPILIKLVRLQDKENIMRNKRTLGKASKVYINEDLTKEERMIQAALRQKGKELKRSDPAIKFTIRGKKMLIRKDGKITSSYGADDKIQVSQIPNQ